MTIGEIILLVIEVLTLGVLAVAVWCLADEHMRRMRLGYELKELRRSIDPCVYDQLRRDRGAA